MSNDRSSSRRSRRALLLAAVAVLLVAALALVIACSGGSNSSGSSSHEGEGSSSANKQGASEGSGEGSEGSGEGSGEGSEGAQSAASIPADLPNGLLLAYSGFVVEDGHATARPAPAFLEILTRSGGEWHVERITDEASNVFHKALVYTPPGGQPSVLTLGGMAAAVKLWTRDGSGESPSYRSRTLWTEEFGGRFNRMRDAEVADLFGDGRPSIAIATHDQGVVAVLHPNEDGSEFENRRLYARPNTFIHEIEIGDLNGDGHAEVYATPSEPNTLDGSEQRGQVLRFDPRVEGGNPTVVADLGNRHAKEIWVGDADGDGRDELYVAVEALTEGRDPNVTIVEPVEIRRYDHDTSPTEGVVVARIQDRLCRFLTVGDVDGDGRREMVAAAFRSGLWLLRPGRDPRSEWGAESIDRDSSGFEHSALLTDLDGDGTDELYVAADDQQELRRYVWQNGRARRESVHTWEVPRSRMTWNIMPIPRSWVGGGSAE